MYARAFIRRLAFLLLLPLVVAAGAAQAAFTFISVSSTTFYTDTSVSPNLTCNYQGFAITSSTAVTDGWARISGFSASLSLGGGDDGIQHLGSFTAGQTKYAYFYVCSSFAGSTQAGEGYTVSMFDRNPTVAGAVSLGSQAFTVSLDNTVIQAAQNSVSVIFAGPNPAVLGGTITMTVEGDTGTIGNAPGPNGPLVFTPAAYTNWNAAAYELFAVNITLSGGNGGSFDNTLVLTSLPNPGTTHYVVTYSFRAIASTSTSTALCLRRSANCVLSSCTLGMPLRTFTRAMVPPWRRRAVAYDFLSSRA